jgi:heme/copper-type cytochrome/quinol oxidase subunit 2
MAVTYDYDELVREWISDIVIDVAIAITLIVMALSFFLAAYYVERRGQPTEGLPPSIS